MKNISGQLLQFIKESLHPNIITGRIITETEFEKWKSFIDNAIAELSAIALKPSFSSYSRKPNAFELIQLITDLSNIVNEYLTRYSKVWQKNPMARKIRQSYLSTCSAFEGLLEVLARKYPEIAAQSPYSHYAIHGVKEELRLLAGAAKQHLLRQDVNFDLSSIFTSSLNHIINQRNLKRADDVYVRKLVDALVKKNFSDSSRVIDFLIINDFNLPEFFLFCLERWNDQITEQEGLLEQKEKLLDLKSHLYDLSYSFGLQNPWGKHRLYNELNKYLSEKFALAKERLKISRQLLQNDNNLPKSKRMLINLSVAQLGLFLRMQVEKGVLAKEHIGELFAFYARHYYTPNTDFISSESLQKKSSVVEHATAKKLKALLISMLNWLNTNYNLSNYN
jgi:hypothetical protein